MGYCYVKFLCEFLGFTDKGCDILDLATVSKCRIFNEFSPEQSEEWFSYKKNTFINHIDTLYFCVYPDSPYWKTDERKLELCTYLKDIKEYANSTGSPVPCFDEFSENLEVRPFFSFAMYTLHFGRRDCFDVFISESLPNPSTPPIVVQLRSQFLWLLGSRNSFDVAADCVEMILMKYGIKIIKVQENRIDYAFHTNYIQDLLHFFPEHSLREMQISNFERWHKEGNFVANDILCDYFTLGRRKSNNVFFRVYNKSKEVIEQGYKQFFIPIWRSQGLISKFDMFLLEKAFIYHTYESRHKARCEFYINYGSDPSIKLQLMELVNDVNTSTHTFKKYADKLVPDITVVCNIEFQTKRKYYDRLDIERVTKDTSYKANMYNIFEVYKSIVDKLTFDTLRFVKYKGIWGLLPRTDRPLAYWWELLRASRSFEFDSDEDYDIIRHYQNNLDKERRKNMALSSIAGNSAYLSGCANSPFENDLFDMLASLNDNDIAYYYRKKIEKYKDLKRKGLVEDEKV